MRRTKGDTTKSIAIHNTIVTAQVFLSSTVVGRNPMIQVNAKAPASKARARKVPKKNLNLEFLGF